MFTHIYIFYILLLEVACGWRIRPRPPPPVKDENGISTIGSNENRLNLIFPGTRWCGSGNVAQGYNDLGYLESTDRCCRTHGNCDGVIEAGTRWCGSGNVAQGYNDLGYLEFTDRCCRAHENCDDVIEVGQTALEMMSGTRWCGSGNVAQGYNDLGYLESTDRCCRAHDNCDDVIEAGQTAHGLTNNDFYSKLHCNCDEEFRRCLRADGSQSSSLIGHVYFDALNTQCFRKDFPVIQCATYYTGSERCQEYQLDKTAPKVYQFFDVPLF
ncbi:uncharacterized protein LOC124358555 [Homalodisca vitripennis]|uniref:uncharacterized protein LOC124358555 n=1 Tax=Homalodisca vitripennis TaxID=197043 RepID=UPI001EECF1DE|nr:uncharacterized protein LOC124358555 [Homalodisca vitripennis]